MKKFGENGITLIAMIITIIVMLILAGVSLNAVIGENGILTQAISATLSQRLASYKEEFEMALVDLYANGESTSVYAINDAVKNYIESLEDNDVGTIAIYDGSLVYLTDNSSEQEIATNLGYLTMSDEDYNYMLELTLIENAILKIEENGSTRVGLQMGTNEYGQVTIAGINYGLGWYIIGSDSTTFDDELAELGITDTDVMMHYPYIVKYTTGAVQSVPGKMMYAGTDTEIWKYTFNYTGEEGGLVVANLLNGVTSDSTKTSTQYGNMTQTKTYASSGTTAGVIENYYVDDYTYDEDGGLVMTETTNIAISEISDETNIASEFTVMVTIKANLSQTGTPDASQAQIFSISCAASKWTCSISVRKNLLTFVSYKNFLIDPDASANYMDSSREFIGVSHYDIGEYSEKYLNIIVTAKKGESAKIYLNGNLALEGDAGEDDFDYEYVTIGDLRPGRGRKFVGTIYNYALYGAVLSEEEIAQNWIYVSSELGIDENGDKIN